MKLGHVISGLFLIFVGFAIYDEGFGSEFGLVIIGIGVIGFILGLSMKKEPTELEKLQIEKEKIHIENLREEQKKKREEQTQKK